MAAIESQETSSTPYSYHVFLSFRGKDTRKTFTDHLYTALLHAGIRTFRDDDELGRGENIYSELQKAIKESRISIIVFSKDYASSTWCLDELLRILELNKTVDHMILPVFYHVRPSDVRWLKESFGEAFVKHEMRFKSELITRWKETLKEVANMSGLELTPNDYESKFIQEIIKEVGYKLNRTVLGVCSYPVGLDSRINEINLWLQDGSDEVGIMAICGMRGIGKTTIAKTVYNLNFDRFEGSSFLANVRETSKESHGLVCLQRLLLSDILKGKEIKISNVDEGIIKIREAIWCKRILLVLDDVDDQEQLKALLAMRNWFKKRSKIIITTTNDQLLGALEPHMKHVKNLTGDESFQFFSLYAFGQDHPIEGYMEHTKRVVKYCGGLPLALQILGSSLYGRTLDVFESAIKKLEAIPDSQIIRKLKISFDSLEGDHDKNLFLDIVAFFVGKKKDFVITVLDGCKYFTKFGIDNLTRRCLLTINYDNNLTMHQLLQYMGRDIIRQESLKDPGKRSRLWHHEDALNVLREKNGTETIEGLILNLHGSNSSTESSSTSNEEDLQTDAFSKMRNLRLLQLNNVRLMGDYEKFPRKLIWLCWSGFSLEFIPTEFCLEKLVVLEMKNSNMKQVWKGEKLLRSLKILNLSHSHSLTETPDFSNVPYLERLILKDCINLIKVHESIGQLKSLMEFILTDCTNLQFLPELPMSLQFLDLKNCRSLEIITMNLEVFRRLDLYVDGCKKLVEVNKLFRLEPIGNIDTEMIKNLELVELESMENNFEVKMFNNMTLEEMIGPIQGLYEYAYGIFSIFDPWNEVPHRFIKRSTKPQIHLKVPSRPNHKIRGLNVCVVYAYGLNPNLNIFNKTKDVEWKYYPTFKGIPDEGKNMRWSSHWKIENQLEAGDEVLVKAGDGSRYFIGYESQVKELGVHIVYEEEDKDTNHNTNGSCPGDVIHAVDLSSYKNSHKYRKYTLRHYNLNW